MRLFAISDLHTDHKPNHDWVLQLSLSDYTQDAVIIAGDISDRFPQLEETLQAFVQRFASVYFVPGNHELWIRRGEYVHSIEKFERILQLCESLGVYTYARKEFLSHPETPIWIIPLFSWYLQPEEGEGSLFRAKSANDRTAEIWNDFHFTQWPDLGTHTSVADYFLSLNKPYLQQSYDAPIITFSHFLPRQDLIFSTPEERKHITVPLKDPYPSFNFTRVAGCHQIEMQLRQLHSVLHIYGHQHRLRNRLIDGVRYISHCLGYPRERGMPWFHKTDPTLFQIHDFVV